MARRIAFLGFPNLVPKSYCAISVPPGYAGVEPAGMEAVWLKTEEPSELARITTLDPLVTRWLFTFTKGSNRSFGGFAVPNSNLSPWGLWRVVNGQPTYQDLAPSAVVSSTNAGGAVTDVDEVAFSPDGAFMTPTVTTSDWAVRLGFPTPAAAPSPGPYRSIFVVRAALQGAPSLVYPQVTASLYQGSTFVQSLGRRAVTQSGGQLLMFPWDPTLLPDASGLNVRVNLSFERGDGGSYAKLDLARWYSESAVPVLDSGWRIGQSGAFTNEDGPPPTQSFGYFPPTPWTGVGGLTLLVMDDQTEHNPDIGAAGFGVPVNNVDVSSIKGYVQAGGFYAGEAIFLSHGIRRGSSPGVHVTIEEVGGVTQGGQTYAADSFRRRGTSSLDLLVTRDEGLTLLNRLGWRRGRSGAFYVAIEPDIDPSLQLFNSFPATLKELGDMVPMPDAIYKGDGTMLFSMTCQLEEKL